jgi:hypothetical protein
MQQYVVEYQSHILEEVEITRYANIARMHFLATIVLVVLV